jgi:hypothetical protein
MYLTGSMTAALIFFLSMGTSKIGSLRLKWTTTFGSKDNPASVLFSGTSADAAATAEVDSVFCFSKVWCSCCWWLY